MLTFPNLPTDSLYKFIFIAGVVMLVTSFYLTPKIIVEYGMQRFKIDSLEMDYQEKIRIAKKLTDSVDEKIKENDRVIAKPIEEADAIITSTPKRRKQSAKKINKHLAEGNEFEKKRKEIFGWYDKSKQLSRNLHKIAIDSMYIHDKGLLIKASYDANYFLLKTMIFFGFLTTVIGGFLWYFNIQKYQDEVLKLQYQEMLFKVRKQDVENCDNEQKS